MNIAFLTTEEPLYLPAFFDRALRGISAAGHGVRMYASPPLYRNQSSLQAARRYLHTFGWGATLQLSARVLACKVTGRSVAATARRWGVPYSSVVDVNAPGFLERLRSESTDLLVSVSCPQIFKRPLIGLPPLGTLNIHGAILPQYRGVMPSFWMLANGERRAGVSIYFVNEAIDAGELCGQTLFDIDPDETLDAFLRRSKALAADLLLETLGRLTQGVLVSSPLDLSQGSYYSWPTPEAVARFRAAGRRLW
jgi:methionyl-tRNA formyltransferase